MEFQDSETGDFILFKKSLFNFGGYNDVREMVK